MTARPPAPPVYHWPPWVPAAALAFLVGAGESLKSWLALGIAVATAAGRTVFADDSAEATIAAGPVLYLTAENSLEEEQRRCGLLKIGLRLPDELPLTFVAAHSLSLASEAEYRAVVGLVEQLHPVAILVDSAIAVAGLSDENDNARVRTFLKSRIVPLARAYQATVYVIAHAPKPPVKPGLKLTDEHAARGASDWRNAADVMLSLRREPALGPAAVMLRATKVRIGCRPTPLWFFLDERDGGIRLVRGGEYSDETATAGGPAPKVREAVLAALDALQRAGEAGLQLKILLDTLREAGVSPATARRAVDLLRGRTSWEYGPHQGQAHAVVREGKTGRKVTLVLSAHGVDLFEGDEHSIFEADEDPEP